MLPPLNENGDLPPGVHVAGWREIEQRFGRGSEGRIRALATLKRLHQFAVRSGALRNFYVFGSFLSATAEPRHVAERHSQYLRGKLRRRARRTG